jgi:hypothetical protein
VTPEKRPHGATTWEGVRENLLPVALEGEATEVIRAFAAWTPEAVEQVGSQLAREAARVWY